MNFFPIDNGAVDVKTIWMTLGPILTFFLGFFLSRFTMTKKERTDVDQKNFEDI